MSGVFCEMHSGYFRIRRSWRGERGLSHGNLLKYILLVLSWASALSGTRVECLQEALEAEQGGGDQPSRVSLVMVLLHFLQET